MFNEDYPLNFIRFGLQRKKEFLRDVGHAYDGLVIPANILLYQYKSTPTLVLMCKPRYFFIDPMSYLFGQPYEEFKRKVEESFKPSFEKLMAYHGLPIEQFVRYDYTKLLRFIDSSERNLKTFVKNALEFQKNTVVSNINKYARDLVNVENLDKNGFIPKFLIPPYFLYEKNEITTLLNYKILEYAASLKEDTPIFPMVFIKKEDLTSGFWKEIQQKINTYKFAGYCLWVDNFREFEARQDEIEQIINLVSILSQDRKVPVIMMYGGYFSLLLYHYGLVGVCHGTSFSESRGAMDSVRQSSGPAPIRYYIRELHRFVPLDSAKLILESDPSLICNCQVCQRVVRGVPDNITNYREQEPLAEMHFLWNRFQEKQEVGRSNLTLLRQKLDFTYKLYEDVSSVTRKYKLPWGEEERPIVDTQYIRNWATALGPSP